MPRLRGRGRNIGRRAWHEQIFDENGQRVYFAEQTALQ